VKSPLDIKIASYLDGEGSFHKAQEKKMMDWFKTKRKWKAHKSQKTKNN